MLEVREVPTADSVRVDEVAQCGIASLFLLQVREFIPKIADLES
jgi:hypothetical protein